MAVDLATIKRLRELTGVGITDAKKALEETNGDFDAALKAMRVKGMAKADKKSEREAKAGLVDAYVHSDRIGAMVEVNCETDFVARTDDFKTLVHDLAMHVAAASPRYVAAEDVTEADKKAEQDLIAAELKEQNKPQEMIDKIVEGKMKKFYSEVCLLNQPFIKDPDKTVGDLVKEHVAKLGENIVVRRIARIELGQVND